MLKFPLRRANQRGQTLTEYTLIIVLVVVACLVALKLFGAQIRGLLTGATTEIARQTSSQSAP